MRVTVALVAALAVGLLGGCAEIPHTGSVRQVEGDRMQDQNAVRYNPPGPADDADPTQVVYGFLDAMLAFPVRNDVASRFLTNDAADEWEPRSRTLVYSQPRVGAADEEGQGTSESDRREVSLTYTQAATLSARGRYTAGGDRDATVTWELVREGGQWRISNPPDGVMVSEQYFDDYYLPLSLYYFDHSADRLVADPVYQPEGDQLATTLTSALLRGPKGLLAGEARSFVPKDTSLDVSVPVSEEGVANVRLSGPIRDLSASEQERLAAQVVWTVRQAHGVSGVRISVNGTVLQVPGASDVQSTEAWDKFDPAAADNRLQAFAWHDDRLVVLSGTTVSRFSGPWGEERSDAVDFRVDPALERIALVSKGRRTVSVSSLSNADESRLVASGTDMLGPVWDTDGRLWVIDRGRRSSSLTVVDGNTRHEVSLGRLARTRITSFELSPDNTRFVAVARPRGRNGSAEVYVGAVGHAPDSDRIDGLTRIHAMDLADQGLSSPLSAAWRSSVGVVVLSSLEGGDPQPYVARIDGSDVSGGPLTREPLLPDIGAREVICSGILAGPVYVADSKNRVWIQDVNGRWQKVAKQPLRAPSFPG